MLFCKALCSQGRPLSLWRVIHKQQAAAQCYCVLRHVHQFIWQTCAVLLPQAGMTLTYDPSAAAMQNG